jgi:hypothetical protein
MKRFLMATGMAILLIVLAMLMVSVMPTEGAIPEGNGQETCPDGGEWTKVDNGNWYAVQDAVEYCFKAGSWDPLYLPAYPAQGFGNEGSCSESIYQCELSHWSYRIEEEEETPTPTNTPTPTETPEETETPPPSETPEVTPTPTSTPKPCKRETVFYWSDGWCKIRQRGGPIMGQTRPFLPDQNAYCGCDYAHEEGWEGLYAVSDCDGGGEEYTFWNELPQYCGYQSCE